MTQEQCSCSSSLCISVFAQLIYKLDLMMSPGKIAIHDLVLENQCLPPHHACLATPPRSQRVAVKNNNTKLQVSFADIIYGCLNSSAIQAKLLRAELSFAETSRLLLSSP
jgi:hypothetical protein